MPGDLVVNLTAVNTEDFQAGVVLTDTAVAYTLMDGTVRAHMRVLPSSTTPLFEFTSVQGGPSKGSITLTPTAAVGWVQFTRNPAADATLTIGETDITFVTSGAGGLKVAIAPDLDGTLVNLATALSASSDPDVAAQAYTASDSRLDVAAKAPGIAGNATALACTVSGATVSGPALGGGGVLLALSAAYADIRRFLGTYAYDVRFTSTDGGTVGRLFRGSLTFEQGVTR